MAEEAKLNFDADPFAEDIKPDFTINAGETPAQDPVTDETTEDNTDDGGVAEQQEDAAAVSEQEEVPQTESEEPVEEIVEETEAQDEVSEDAPVEEVVEVIEDIEPEAAPVEEAAPVSDLPEGVDKLVNFIKETGGTLEDYIKLNRDFTDMSEDALLMEYYQQAKPHWSAQDIKDHLEDEFTLEEEYDEGEEMSREDRRKLRLKKEEVNKAKQFLQGQKEKYYENLKYSSQQSAAQQSAEAKAQAEAQEQIRVEFTKQSETLFNDEFSGFVFDGGDKKFRIKEQGNKLYESQVDLNNVLGSHLNEDGSIKDLNAYHKALYAFNNADKIFSHAYQQGKADALKERAKSTKNIDMTPKTTEAKAGSSNKPKLSFDVTPPGWN